VKEYTLNPTPNPSPDNNFFFIFSDPPSKQQQQQSNHDHSQSNQFKLNQSSQSSQDATQELELQDEEDDTPHHGTISYGRYYNKIFLRRRTKTVTDDAGEIPSRPSALTLTFDPLLPISSETSESTPE